MGQIDENLNRFAQWYHARPTEKTRAGFVCLYIFLHHETDQLSPWHQLLQNIMDIDEALCLLPPQQIPNN
ncbi:MAG: hypothetical protein EBY16_05920 [Gammaproteobacteria bacterium]|nr:hypothetical protein [Gammaproteobacteria bacterium]